MSREMVTLTDAVLVKDNHIAHVAPAELGAFIRDAIGEQREGLSFVQVHDGSTFDPIQVVAQNSLPNYEDVITKISTGCSVVATSLC